eukprot:COSAG01_NODE_21672_length_891_cov_0.833333_2_plen_99_part_00
MADNLDIVSLSCWVQVPNQAMISKMAGSFKGKENGAVDHSAPKHKSKRTPLGQAVQQKPGGKRLTIAERAQQVCACLSSPPPSGSSLLVRGLWTLLFP